MTVYLAYYIDDLIDVFDSIEKAKKRCEELASNKVDTDQSLEWQGDYLVIVDNLNSSRMVVGDVEQRKVK